MAAIYDALGNYMGDDGAPGPGALTPVPAPTSVAPLAGTAPISGVAPFQVYPPNVMGPMPPALQVADLNPSMEQPTDIMGYGGELPQGALDPNFYGSDTGALMAPDVIEPGALDGTPVDTGLFSFLNKPGASDSLVAFGSAMLRAPDFNTGLANAADAVTQVAQQYRMPTPREMAIAQMKGRIASAASGNADAQGNQWDLKNPVVGKDGRMYYPGQDAQGNVVFRSDSGEVVTSVPGMMTPTYSEIANRNRTLGAGQGKEQVAVEAEVLDANSKISQYDNLLSLVDTAGVGTDVWTQVTGRLAELSGMDIGGIDLTDRGVAQQQIASMNVAASAALRGQGQVTEFERKLLADTLPQMTMDPQAAKTVIDILKKAEQRKIDQYLQYQDELARGSTISWTMFQLKYRQKLDASERNTQSSGGTGNTSIFDEADAIVGN